MRKVIIAGGRNFSDYGYLCVVMDMFVPDRVEIVSGGAKGADSLGERYARERGLKLTRFPADWDTHGKRAGFLRNKKMADYADLLVAFWDGSSKGTKHMIDLMTVKDPAAALVFLY